MAEMAMKEKERGREMAEKERGREMAMKEKERGRGKEEMAEAEKERGRGKEEMAEEKDHTIRIKHDLMHEGLDWNHILQYEEKIDELQKKALVPLDYSIHAPIQLIPERVIDTTNRSLVIEAQRDGFDPEGFRQGKPLQKDLFYMNPYITCSWCNTMNYVDVIKVRRMLTLPEELKDQIKGESLPACDGCGRADGFEVGAKDFIEQIERRKREEEERKQRILNSTIKLQRMYRAHLRYMYGYAYNRKMKAKAKLIHRAASQIQAICRVRLARRIFATEKRLLIIKNAHPRLLSRALEKKPGLRSTFWYKTKLEIKLLYDDYVNLCSRTGFQPPRILVEKNIAEIAKRILTRQNELVTMIQKRWRGVMTRRIIKLYALERIRLRQWCVSFVMKIQRCYRGHFSRLTLPNFMVKSWREKIQDKYLLERRQSKQKLEKKNERDKVKLLYQKARKDEYSCRVLNRIEDPEETAQALRTLTSSKSFRIGSVSRSATEDNETTGGDAESPNRWYYNEYSHRDEDDDEQQRAQEEENDINLQTSFSLTSNAKEGYASSRPQSSGGVVIYEKKKMILFSKSCYSSDHFKNSLNEFLSHEIHQIHQEKQHENQQKQRKNYLYHRIAEHGPRGYGTRGYAYSLKGMNALPDHLNHKIFLKSTPKQQTSSSMMGMESGKKKRSKTPKKAIASVEPAEYRVKPSRRSQGMNAYHLQEIQDIIHEEIERSTHEFKKVNMKEKIEEFNQSVAYIPERKGGPRKGHQGGFHGLGIAAGAGGGGIEGDISSQDLVLKSISSKASQRMKSSSSSSGVAGHGSAARAEVREEDKSNNKRKYKYKYPVDVNVDPLQWLYDDIDTTIQYQDQQMKLKRASSKV